ncbi:MAG: methylmalonyl Co-A mutase-associated GTPase MeaB [Bacteroidetes bacterium]|nr:MAG: methylmalonyl Co-A mutase-associated GTPase MeaB [Bacteroidota bacterium]
MSPFQTLRPQLLQGQFKALARCISLVESGYAGWQAFMQRLPLQPSPIIGLTGPPGAGKSTLADGLVGQWVAQGKTVGVLCIDPSSPFNLGALLGDRIRMSQWYNHPGVFIRSLASRGSMGGLHPFIIPIADLMKAAGFDIILLETVGVGQTEIDIAGLADATAVVLVPEAGDDVQAMKAGLMEIADVFVVNKADRPQADVFARHLRQMLPTHAEHPNTPIFSTVASTGQGLPALGHALLQLPQNQHPTRKHGLLALKAWQLMAQQKMGAVNVQTLQQRIAAVYQPQFNLYQFVDDCLANDQ